VSRARLQLHDNCSYYNADEKRCTSFNYNGMRGNQNNFITMNACETACPSE